MMETIYKSLGAIIGFSVIVLLVQNFVGEKAAEYTVLFTLLTMLLLNVDKVTKITNSLKED